MGGDGKLAGYLPFAEDLGYDGPPFRSDPEHRALIKAELGAYFAYLYALSRDYIVSTGNGSGKSLTYLVPIFDAILRDDLARHSRGR